MALIYITVAMIAIVGFASLAVDLGRVQLARTQLQQAADAAARYGASGLKNVLDGTSAAASNAVMVAGQNIADGSPVVVDPNNDVQLVIWNSATRTYTVTSDPSLANAVRVTARRAAARGTGVPLYFGKLIGQSTCDVNASAIAVLTAGASQDITVPATSNPFLAGMPAGSVASLNNPHNNPDYAPTNSPVAANGITVNPGSTLTFDGINGSANNDIHDSARYTADGNLGWMCDNTNGSENGISDLNAPINCLVGLFLDDSQPNSSSAPSTLDFTSDSSRDFTSLAPQLKQIFFIGDGRTSSGEVQHFTVPTGATRLYIATWDSYEWNNNVGTFSMTIHMPGSITLVK